MGDEGAGRGLRVPPRWVEMGTAPTERERERESQRYQGVGIVYRANQNQPFQRTTLSLPPSPYLLLSLPYTRVYTRLHAYGRVYTVSSVCVGVEPFLGK